MKLTPPVVILECSPREEFQALGTATQNTALRAILFADISGSTKLYETLGNSKAQRIVDQCLGILTGVTENQKGTVIKKIGDELMCTFESVDQAARAAAEMQQSLKMALAYGKFEVTTLHIRVGFHAGPVIVATGDVFGDAVNVAARVTAQTKAGQVLTTSTTLELLSPEIRTRTRFIDRVGVKGKSEDLELFELLWEFENLTVVEDAFRPSSAAGRIRLNYNGVEVALNKDRPALRFGRGAENDFVIPDTQASRLHARVELRRDRFVLVDQSLNGTYVTVESEPEVCLRRDELALKGAGVISLGRSINSDASIPIRFTCD